MRNLVITIGLSALAASGAGAAAPARSPADTMVSALRACRQVTDPAQRLACFDKAAASLTGAVEQGEVTLVTREQATKTRRSLFGFAVPEFPFFKRRAGESDLREISTRIVSVRPYGPNRYRLGVAEADAVWETTEELAREPLAGQPVTIQRGALGSYWIKVGNGREVRGRRVR